MQERFDSGMANAYWWYGSEEGNQPGAGYNYYSSEMCSTTEEMTEGTDSRGVQEMYRSYPAYRVGRVYNPAQYYYPVRRRAHHRRYTIPCQTKFAAHNVTPPITEMGLPRRRPSQQPYGWPQLTARYGYPTPVVPAPNPTAHRKKHKPAVNDVMQPSYCDTERRHARVFWKKTKKPPIRRKVDWESSTSADGKSIHTAYSRLSVDVAQEIAAVNRDLETLLAQYKTSCDRTSHAEWERFYGQDDGKAAFIPSNLSVHPRSSQSPERKRLLLLEKPPLERLPEMSFEHLKPRPPSTLLQKKPSETPSEEHESSSRAQTFGPVDGNAMWSSMLQDLVNRGVIDKLDDSSLAKLQKTLTDVKNNDKDQLQIKKSSICESPGRSENRSIRRTEHSEVQKPTTASQLGETIVLQELDNKVLHDRHIMKSPTISTAPVPSFIERTKKYIPVNTVDESTNWRTELQGYQGLREDCQRCRGITTEEFNVNQRAGVKVDSERSRTEGYHPLKNASASPSGDPEVTNWMKMKAGIQDGSVQKGDKINSKQSLKGGNVEGSSSQITVNSAITDPSVASSALSSSNATCMNGDSSATSDTKKELKVTVEDISEEDELPLQPTSEITSMSSRAPSVNQVRSPITSKISFSLKDGSLHHNHLGREFSMSGRTKDETQGGGDNPQVNDDVFKQELKSLLENLTSEGAPIGGDATNQTLQEQSSKKASKLNTDVCLEIIRKVVGVMSSQEPIINAEWKGDPHMLNLMQHRKNHMDHILKEVDHIKHADSILANPSGLGSMHFYKSKQSGSPVHLPPSYQGGK